MGVRLIRYPNANFNDFALRWLTGTSIQENRDRLFACCCAAWGSRITTPCPLRLGCCCCAATVAAAAAGKDTGCCGVAAAAAFWMLLPWMLLLVL
jgi:hypothetical protein